MPVSPISISKVGETSQRMSPASKWMFEGEPRHLVMVLLDQEPIGLLGIQQERDDVCQGRDQDPSQSGVAGRDLLD